MSRSRIRSSSVRIFAFACAILMAPMGLAAQTLPSPLDPARSLAEVEAPKRRPLPEEYIWTANDVTVRRRDHNKYPWNRPELRTTPHLFRKTFQLKSVPAEATLYLAGPREAHVFVNGRSVGDFMSDVDAPIGFHVFHVDVKTALHPGQNVIAIEAVRGRGIVSATNSKVTQQLAYGEILAVKIVPARFGVDDLALMISDGEWRSVPKDQATATDWASPNFDDASWPKVESLGPVESNVDFFQWSADAGMYGWPGYMGMSAALRTYPLRAAAVGHVYMGQGAFENLDALTKAAGTERFSVSGAEGTESTDADAPSLLLDFGREIAGRVVLESESASECKVSVAYGESELEAMATGLTPGQQGGNYLGTNVVEVPAHGMARGPKSGFRYARIRFLRCGPKTLFKSIRAEGIYYPVNDEGSFESSDPELNRIWEVGAYTAHLCMQEGIWDAAKRDRGRWVGDLDVEGRVISDVFGDSALAEETLRSTEPEKTEFVNGIPGYSALWLTSLESLYQHSGDTKFLEAERGPMERVLAGMDASLDTSGEFRNEGHHWLFVDWSPGLYGYTKEAEIGTALQYVRGYRAAARLYRAVGDEASAKRYEAQADRVLTPVRGSYGQSWQLNALAQLVDAKEASEGVGAVLSKVKQDSPQDQVISPYFNAYVLDAMAAAGQNEHALAWMKAYWGGMLAEGATSFWESYDLRWPKGNAHLSLQADGTSGFFVSMAHGWSSGPTAWLTENVLGVTPASAGYETVSIHPRLMGLQFVKGAVPTPHGTVRVQVNREGIEFDLPPGISKATVQYEAPGAVKGVRLDGKALQWSDAARHEIVVAISQPGHHVLSLK